jgi:hypothetical protein
MIAQMDTDQKLNLLMDYQNKKTIDFEDGLESQFKEKVKKLENDRYLNGYYLGEDDILKLVDNVTKIDNGNIEKFNILFDKTLRRLKLFSCGNWDSYLEDIGCTEVIRLIKSYFFDTYEVYLVRNLHCDENSQSRAKLREHLEIYYRFIGVFELNPTIYNMSDDDILGHRLVENDEFHLSNRYTKLFHDLKKELRISEKNKIKRKIACIIKENTQYNLGQLNKAILELLQIDGDFKQEILKLKNGFD